MKKLMLLAGVACLFAANANAEVNQYVSAKVSYDLNKLNVRESAADADVSHARLDKELFGTHVAYGVQAGYVRAEVELNNSRDIKRNYVSDENFSVEHFRMYKHSVMANAYFDMLTCTAWTPYVGAGIGLSYLKADFGEEAKSAYNLGWQVMGGITYDVNSNWTLDLGYRYADNGRVRKNWGAGKATKVSARDHEIMFGARYSF